jgi:short-subunit dehydrogenase
VNFKVNVDLVWMFFDSLKEFLKSKIIINLSIVAAHTRQMNMSTYEASKGALIIWLEHVHFENLNKLRVHNLHSNIILTDLLKNREFRADDWNWDMRKLSFSIMSDYDMMKLTNAHSTTFRLCSRLTRFWRSRLLDRSFYLSQLRCREAQDSSDRDSE